MEKIAIIDKYKKHYELRHYETMDDYTNDNQPEKIKTFKTLKQAKEYAIKNDYQIIKVFK